MPPSSSSSSSTRPFSGVQRPTETAATTTAASPPSSSSRPPPLPSEEEEELLRSEIESMVAARSRHRRAKEWAEADSVKALLAGEPYRVAIDDFADGSSAWRFVPPVLPGGGAPVVAVEWSELPVLVPVPVRRRSPPHPPGGAPDLNGREADRLIPLVIATVDAPHYRSRLGGTVSHLLSSRKLRRGDGGGRPGEETAGDGDGEEEGRPPDGGFGGGDDDYDDDDECSFDPVPVDLLNLERHPNLDCRTVLFEGWRTVLLPAMLSRSCTGGALWHCRGGTESESESFVLVAEDDVRLPPGVAADRIRDEASAAFAADPTLDVLSLGHAWGGCASSRPNRRLRRRRRRRGGTDSGGEEPRIGPRPTPDLLGHLRSGKGAHGTTLLAVRFPGGARRLLNVLDAATKRTHLDQYLFHSPRHDLGVALRDPPLAGWSEANATLTTSGSGHRRKGGGRRGFLPPSTQDGGSVRWVRRSLVEQQVAVAVAVDVP